MRKIGIVTVCRTFNFGAELQAFALQYKLNLMGFNAEVVDYLYFKNKRHNFSTLSKPELTFPLREKIKNNLLYKLISPLLDTVLPVLHNSTKIKVANFRDFHERNTNFSTEFRDLKSLYKYKHDYDIYITGSDQVWNPATFSSLKPYLLDFVPEGKNRVAYAASFGVSKVNNEYKVLYNELFEKLNFIGVREGSGRELVNQISGRDSKVVLDPTLLLEKKDWVLVANNANIGLKQPYLLIYDLHPSEPLLKLAYALSQRLNLKIYRLCKRSYRNPLNMNIKNISDAGPSEFISLFINANYVITNSFHGTIFSINFNIPFTTVLNKERENNSRITDFLETVNLKSRIFWEDDDIKLSKSEIFCFCDFNQSNATLNKLRSKSVKFLLNSLF